VRSRVEQRTHAPRRWQLAWGVVVSVTLVLAACSGSPGGSGASDTGTANFKVGTYEGLWLEAPVYVAQEKGIFKKHGLNVDRVNIQSGPTQLAAASSGGIDAITLTTNAVMLANSKGQTFEQLIGNIPHQIYGLAGLKKVMDACPNAKEPYPKPILCMKGKRIGVTALGSDNYNVAVSLLQDVGLTKDDVTLLPLGGAVQLGQAMLAGQTDFIVSVEPAPTQVEEVSKIAVPVVPLRTGSTNKYFTTWAGEGFFATDKVLKSNPKMYQGFVDAIVEATDWTADPANQAELITIFKKYAPNTPADTLDALAKTAPDTFGARLSCKGIENARDWLVQTNQMTGNQGVKNCQQFVWDYTAKRYLK